MKTWIVIGGAALQCLVLAYMATERELIFRTGRTIYLRTAPIDPRDAFRGDFVRLDYEIGHATTNQSRDGLRSQKQDGSTRKDIKVYAALKMHGDLASLDYVSDRKPADAEVVLRGRAGQGGANLSIRYGLEAYFVEQGKGLDLERGRSEGEIQIPLEMEVAVSGNGKSVLKGHRWSPIGIGLAIENDEQTATNNLSNRTVTNRVVVAATLTLMNASSNAIAVVDLPQGKSIDLGPDTIRGWSRNNWAWTSADQQRPAPTDADVHVLKPGEKYSIRIDLRDPQWFVRQGKEPPRAITGLGEWSDQFRLFYRPPAREECRQLQHANLIWHGNLPSRAFNGGGRVD
ncbi:MAG: GDYXXLXY domain-containing protein [Verrucomicrobia bacterium]|nr:GDYXXLXY domain-containing protein [Verrucomicrobiota bacterium]MBU4292168.1 GDYXXLXY domain-containing protein [Verrucomicrobiota bacterium]MBU4429996.1 GDYXXLXY domain-containing protein [Verrucomicrobiota bacterium]MCG2681613.1 GDYXXLXY domain-containing protein [Kiritimatiellia bacterium]